MSTLIPMRSAAEREVLRRATLLTFAGKEDARDRGRIERAICVLENALKKKAMGKRERELLTKLRNYLYEGKKKDIAMKHNELQRMLVSLQSAEVSDSMVETLEKEMESLRRAPPYVTEETAEYLKFYSKRLMQLYDMEEDFHKTPAAERMGYTKDSRMWTMLPTMIQNYAECVNNRPFLPRSHGVTVNAIVHEDDNEGYAWHGESFGPHENFQCASTLKGLGFRTLTDFSDDLAALWANMRKLYSDTVVLANNKNTDNSTYTKLSDELDTIWFDSPHRPVRRMPKLELTTSWAVSDDDDDDEATQHDAGRLIGTATHVWGSH